MFVEAIEDILRHHATGAQVRAIEAGAAPTALWSALESAGFLELLAPEAQGGAGLAWADVFEVLTTFGRHAVPVPVAQSIAARALLLSQGIAPPAGRITLAGSSRRSSNGSLTCPRMAFGLQAEQVLVNDQGTLLLLEASTAQKIPTGVHGSLLATLVWSAPHPAARLVGQGAQVLACSAALHAALLAGVMNKVFDMTLQYANDRVQFGKSIGKFQAIQHQLSVMAEHVAASRVAAEMAFAGQAAVPALQAVAVAKSRCSEAATLVASIAHAVHGAMGVTEEYDLQLYTRRLHEWRLADGSEDYWNQVLGEALLNSPAGVTVSDFARTIVA